MVADGAYRDRSGKFDTPSNDELGYEKAVARARHETVNGRLKKWNVLSHLCRHDVSFHQMCFVAIATITQLEFFNGFGPFSVEYYDAGSASASASSESDFSSSDSSSTDSSSSDSSSSLEVEESGSSSYCSPDSENLDSDSSDSLSTSNSSGMDADGTEDSD
jgi:hypothetical protein